MTKSQLAILLRRNGIDLDQFGRGRAKSLRDLLEEVRTGEASLIEKGGQLTRRVRVIGIDVFAYIDGRAKLLVEDRQVFADGRERRRSLHSVSEKMLPKEDVPAAISRALYEELGIPQFSVLSAAPDVPNKLDRSPSYLGLLTEYETHHAKVRIDALQYRADGYFEVQRDMTTYFVWVEA
jgi:hypothetical protein